MERTGIPAYGDTTEIKIISSPFSKKFEEFTYPHKLNVTAFCTVRQGKAKLSINLNQYEVSQNCIVVLLPSNIVEISECSDDLTVDTIVFSPHATKTAFSPRELFPYLLTISQHPVVTLDNEQFALLLQLNDVVIKICDKLNEEAQKKPSENYTVVGQNFLMSIMHLILMIYEGHKGDFPEFQTRQNEIVHDFLRLVSEHYHKERSINFYADKLCITPKHLSRVVKSALKRSPAAIITHMVILDAKAQLKNTTDTSQQIAHSLNFANPSFFGTYFKKHVGMSPQQYRES